MGNLSAIMFTLEKKEFENELSNHLKYLEKNKRINGNKQ